MKLVFIDLDHFKQINDTYGHSNGDKVLAMMGRIILSNTHMEDLPVRYGGDELLIIFRSCPFDVVDEIVAKIALEFQMASKKILGEEATTSIGIYYSESTTPLEIALEHADEDLYVQKQKRRQ